MGPHEGVGRTPWNEVGMTDWLLFLGLLVLLVLALEVVYRSITGSTAKPKVPRWRYLAVVPAGAALLFFFVNSIFDLPRFWEQFSAGAAAVIVLYAAHFWFARRKS